MRVSLPAVSRALLALTLSLLSPACQQRQPTLAKGRSRPPTGRVIIFAVDGLERDLLDRFISQGHLPNFSRILQEGVSADLVSAEESKSPIIWTTMATGKPSWQHGITDFFVDGSLASSGQRRVRALWKIASEGGIRQGIVGWYVTWPAERVYGYLISDRAEFHEKVTRVAWPAWLSPPLGRYWYPASNPDLKRFTPAGFDPDYRNRHQRGSLQYDRNFLLEDRLVTAFQRDRGYAAIGLDLIRDRRLRLFALYLRGIDFTSHGFWKYFEPSHFAQNRHPDEELFSRIIPEYYDYVDEILGRYFRLLPSDSTVVLISDHGFGPAAGRWRITTRRLRYLSGSHRKEGVFAIWGKHSAGGGARIAQVKAVDLLPTLLHLLGLPQARDLPGRLIAKALDPELRERKLRYVQTYEDHETETARSAQSDADPEIERQLRALGYID